MRGEYCVYGATVLSFISAILLIFANIGQLSTAPVVSGLYMAQVDTSNFDAPYKAALGGADGLFATDAKARLGRGNGVRMFYKYGVYGGCAYMRGAGACNSTMFGYPFEPMGQIMADATTDRGIRGAVVRFMGDEPMSDANYNQVVSRAANLLIFVGTALCGVALIVGIFKTRITFLVATIAAGLSAVLLMVGAAMWTAIIARNASIVNKIVTPGITIGISVNAGAGLYLVWIAFVFQTLAVAPYVISFCTFRRQQKDSFQ